MIIEATKSLNLNGLYWKLEVSRMQTECCWNLQVALTIKVPFFENFFCDDLDPKARMLKALIRRSCRNSFPRRNDMLKLYVFHALNSIGAKSVFNRSLLTISLNQNGKKKTNLWWILPMMCKSFIPCARDRWASRVICSRQTILDAIDSTVPPDLSLYTHTHTYYIRILSICIIFIFSPSLPIPISHALCLLQWPATVHYHYYIFMTMVVITTLYMNIYDDDDDIYIYIK